MLKFASWFLFHDMGSVLKYVLKKVQRGHPRGGQVLLSHLLMTLLPVWLGTNVAVAKKKTTTTKRNLYMSMLQSMSDLLNNSKIMLSCYSRQI